MKEVYQLAKSVRMSHKPQNTTIKNKRERDIGQATGYRTNPL